MQRFHQKWYAGDTISFSRATVNAALPVTYARTSGSDPKTDGSSWLRTCLTRCRFVSSFWSPAIVNETIAAWPSRDGVTSTGSLSPAIFRPSVLSRPIAAWVSGLSASVIARPGSSTNWLCTRCHAAA